MYSLFLLSRPKCWRGYWWGGVMSLVITTKTFVLRFAVLRDSENTGNLFKCNAAINRRVAADAKPPAQDKWTTKDKWICLVCLLSFMCDTIYSMILFCLEEEQQFGNSNHPKISFETISRMEGKQPSIHKSLQMFSDFNWLNRSWSQVTCQAMGNYNRFVFREEIKLQDRLV